MSNAIEDVEEILEKGEKVKAIIFGAWGWNGYDEPEPHPVPHELFGKVLTWDNAKQYMKTWSFRGGFGAPQCYEVRIFTNQRIIWVTQYDGATRLDSAPVIPIEGYIPDMPGG